MNERKNTQLVLKAVPQGLTDVNDFETREVEVLPPIWPGPS